MSVLIKGISMPKEPWDCPCHDGETGWCKVTGSSCFPIPKDCPLVEVSTSHETEQPEYYDYSDIEDTWNYYAEENNMNLTANAKQIKDAMWVGYRKGKESAQTKNRRGRWMSVPHKKARICSECYADEPYKFADDDADVFDFCSHCGADMRGDNDDA